MTLFPLLHMLFFFIVALAILISVHEFGHFWAARRLGVKVIRFSLGFGTPIWSYRKTPEDTEFSVAALPLGGYVKMVDEREGEVAPKDLPYAFNRQPVWRRSVIVFAGPFFNFLLAILVYWGVFMLGETGIRPLLGPVAPDTLAAQAGFHEGDEILTVAGDTTPTWNLAISAIVEKAVDEEPIAITVKDNGGAQRNLLLNIPTELAQQPDQLYPKLGFRPWEIPAIIDDLVSGSAAEAAGLKPGDRIISADGTAIPTWKQWVEYVRAHPETAMNVIVDRDGVRLPLKITPKAIDAPEGRIGQIGAKPRVPENLAESLKVEYQLGPVAALGAAFKKTYDYSSLTLRMVGRMVIGKAAVENLSGPISIAQYAGQSASMGFGQFMKFLAIVSISLGILNLLPIPVLDGGHLFFYLVEAVKGSPLSDEAQMYFQKVGIFILLCLMALAFVLDIQRLLT